MDNILHIGPGTDIDLADMMQSRVIIQGNSGAGKSGIARKMMEESFGKVPFVVWDIEGEYYTLKELSGDIVVIGGLHGDVAITPSLAEKLPAFIIDNRLTVVVDLSDLKMSERVHFTKEFFETLMDLPLPYWTPYQFYLEECHKLAGEQDKQESSTAIKDLMQRGRKRGFCGIVLTQRIGMLSKSVSAECNNKFIGRTSQDNDMDRSGKELGFRKAADSLKLRDLKRGHFYAFGPSMNPDHVHEVIVDKPKTTMVKAGMQLDFKAPKPTGKLLEMLKALSYEEPASPSPRSGEGRGEAENAEIEKLYADINARQQAYAQLQDQFEESEGLRITFTKLACERALMLKKITAFLVRNSIELSELNTIIKELIDFTNAIRPDENPDPKSSHHLSFISRGNAIASGDGAHVATIGKVKHAQPANAHFPIGERNVLSAIADYKTGLTRKALTVITGYTRRTRDAYIFGLRSKEYAELSDDKVVATRLGIKILGADFKPLPKGRKLRDHWLNNLPQGERSILIYMLDKNGERQLPVTREYISQKTGYTRRTRDAYIYNMLAKQILKVAAKGEVQISEYLYD